VAPKLLTDRIDPATEAVIARVAPEHVVDVGRLPAERGVPTLATEGTP
jgi:hypothetical protein